MYILVCQVAAPSLSTLVPEELNKVRAPKLSEVKVTTEATVKQRNEEPPSERAVPRLQKSPLEDVAKWFISELFFFQDGWMRRPLWTSQGL